MYQEPQRTLSRTGSTVVLSTPSCKEKQFLGVSSNFLLRKEGHAGQCSTLLLYKEAWISEKFHRISEVGVWV